MLEYTLLAFQDMIRDIHIECSKVWSPNNANKPAENGHWQLKNNNFNCHWFCRKNPLFVPWMNQLKIRRNDRLHDRFRSFLCVCAHTHVFKKLINNNFNWHWFCRKNLPFCMNQMKIRLNDRLHDDFVLFYVLVPIHMFSWWCWHLSLHFLSNAINQSARTFTQSQGAKCCCIHCCLEVLRGQRIKLI